MRASVLGALHRQGIDFTRGHRRVMPDTGPRQTFKSRRDTESGQDDLVQPSAPDSQPTTAVARRRAEVRCDIATHFRARCEWHGIGPVPPIRSPRTGVEIHFLSRLLPRDLYMYKLL